MTYWQIAHPLILMGLGLPFFFVPLTALALGSVEEHETACAAGRSTARSAGCLTSGSALFPTPSSNRRCGSSARR